MKTNDVSSLCSRRVNRGDQETCSWPSARGQTRVEIPHLPPDLRTYDLNGHQLWERLLPTIGPEPVVHDDAVVVYSFGVHSFAVQPSGRFAIVGDFDGTIDFGDGSLDNADGSGFFAVYDL